MLEEEDIFPVMVDNVHEENLCFGEMNDSDEILELRSEVAALIERELEVSLKLWRDVYKDYSLNYGRMKHKSSGEAKVLLASIQKLLKL